MGDREDLNLDLLQIEWRKHWLSRPRNVDILDHYAAFWAPYSEEYRRKVQTYFDQEVIDRG